MAENVEDSSVPCGSSSVSSSSTMTPRTALKELDSNAPPSPQTKLVQCYELKNGWYHTRKRVPIAKKSNPKSSTPKSQTQHSNSRRTATYSEIYKRSIKHLYHKEKRYTCPDCEAWYAGDKRKVQLTCRHRERYDYQTEEEMKMWNIGFDSDYDDDD